MEQMTIFDFINQSEPLEGKTLEQIAAEISMILGIDFKPKIWEWHDHQTVEYVAKLDKKHELTIDENTYDTCDERHGQRFIGVGYSFGTGGGGAPCDNIDDAVAYLRRRKDEYERR